MNTWLSTIAALAVISIVTYYFFFMNDQEQDKQPSPEKLPQRIPTVSPQGCGRTGFYDYPRYGSVLFPKFC